MPYFSATFAQYALHFIQDRMTFAQLNTVVHSNCAVGMGFCVCGRCVCGIIETIAWISSSQVGVLYRPEPVSLARKYCVLNLGDAGFHDMRGVLVAFQ